MKALLTARQAALELADRAEDDGRARPWCRGMGRRVIASGLAGEPIRIGGVTWLDAERVADLATWSPVDMASLPSPCYDAFLLLRARPTSTPAEWARLANAGAVAAAEISLALRRHGYLPCVVTTCGYVVGGAEVVSLRRETSKTLRLELRPAGAWFAAFHRSVLHTTAGNHWQLRYPSLSPPGCSGWLGSH